jgi:hypothetical protein
VGVWNDLHQVTLKMESQMISKYLGARKAKAAKHDI